MARLVAWIVGLAAAASLLAPVLLERDALLGEIQTLLNERGHAIESMLNAMNLEQEIERMKSMHDRLVASLPDAIDAQVLEDQIRDEAVEAGLQIESLEIAPRQQREFYGQHAVRLVATGPANAAHALLGKILLVPPIRRIDTFSLEQTSDERATGERLELDLHAYDYNAP
jgi:Tfp pilus assembly protein PilO